MVYQVQKGDTIAEVTGLLNMNWATLRRLNPDAIGRCSRSGNWFLKEGAVLKEEESFASLLQKKMEPARKPVEDPAKSTTTMSQAPTGVDRWVEYTIKAGDNLWTLAAKRFRTNLEDILADNAIDDPNKLQPGTKIRVRLPSLPAQMNVVASWYGGFHHGRPMANGKPYDQNAPTIAHKSLPLGTKVELENPETRERVRAVVTDRGPFVKGRDVDLSYGLAEKLSLVEKGVGPLVMRIVG